jgi:nicotinamide-nucleotide amidase
VVLILRIISRKLWGVLLPLRRDFQHFLLMDAMDNLFETINELGDALRQRGWTVSCAESCTGGGVAFYLTSVAGSSDWFKQSWVTYSNEAKHHLLGVDVSTLDNFGAVSAQTVEAMCQGTIAHSGAQVAVAVSGIAGPGGGSLDKPVGTVWFGFYTPERQQQMKQIFDGDRKAVREQAISFAIRTLHQWLVVA